MKHKIHFLLFFLFGVTTSFSSYSQCIANAGNDTALCTYMNLDTFYLGGSPTVTGGIPPYSYTWSCNYSMGSFTLSASNFLDDTTAANPLLVDYFDTVLTFYLSVTDSVGTSCNDSITIQFSQWARTLDDKRRSINQGDSVSLYQSVHGGLGSLTYLWSPAAGLTDPTNVNTWAKPDTTTLYSLLVTDSIGCQVDDDFKVFVIPLGIAEQNNKQLEILVYPNPLENHSVIQFSNPEQALLRFDFYDALGRKVKEISTRNNSIELEKSDFKRGAYFFQLFEGDRAVGQGKLVVN